MVKITVLMLLSMSVVSCSTFDIRGLVMPTGDDVEERFGQSMKINHDLKAEAVYAEKDYTFYVATDPHVMDTYNNVSVFNDTFRNDRDASFGVMLGDYTGTRDNLHMYLDAVAYDPQKHSHDHRLFHVLGNHDLFYNGWVDFRDNLGASVYWFEVLFDGGKDLFITLDTASGTLGRNQTKWLKSFIDSERNHYRHCVILTHTNFFYTDNSQLSSGNMPLEECFSLIDLFGRYDVSLVLQGHDHHREDVVYDNVRYSVTGTMQDGSKAPEFLIVTAKEDGLSLEWNLILD